MPMYDTTCTKCGNQREVRLSAFDSPMPVCDVMVDEETHPCGGDLVRGVSAPAGFHLHGVGTFDHGYVSKKAPE